MGREQRCTYLFFFSFQIFANIIHNKNDIVNTHHETSPAVWKNSKTSSVPSPLTMFQKIVHTLTHWKNTISYYVNNMWISYKVRIKYCCYWYFYTLNWRGGQDRGFVSPLVKTRVFWISSILSSISSVFTRIHVSYYKFHNLDAGKSD